MLNCVLHPEGGIITRLDDALQRRVTEQSAKLVFGLWNAGVFTTTSRDHAVTLLVNEADVDPACLSQSARGVPPIFHLTTGSADVKVYLVAGWNRRYVVRFAFLSRLGRDPGVELSAEDAPELVEASERDGVFIARVFFLGEAILGAYRAG